MKFVEKERRKKIPPTHLCDTLLLLRHGTLLNHALTAHRFAHKHLRLAMPLATRVSRLARGLHVRDGVGLGLFS